MSTLIGRWMAKYTIGHKFYELLYYKRWGCTVHANIETGYYRKTISKNYKS